MLGRRAIVEGSGLIPPTRVPLTCAKISNTQAFLSFAPIRKMAAALAGLDVQCVAMASLLPQASIGLH